VRNEAAGLDALGDRDLAFAGQQVHRAHLAQIHAHRIVGTVRGLLGLGLGRQFRLGRDQLVLALRLLVGLLRRAVLFRFGVLVLDDVDAHLVEHREQILDLLGIGLVGGQHRVDLLVGDVAALLCATDQLLDGAVRQVEQRAVRHGPGTLRLRHPFLLRRHLDPVCHEPLYSRRRHPSRIASLPPSR
jgi:hypothetical protein